MTLINLITNASETPLYRDAEVIEIIDLMQRYDGFISMYREALANVNDRKRIGKRWKDFLQRFDDYYEKMEKMRDIFKRDEKHVYHSMIKDMKSLRERLETYKNENGEVLL